MKTDCLPTTLKTESILDDSARIVNIILFANLATIVHLLFKLLYSQFNWLGGFSNDFFCYFWDIHCHSNTAGNHHFGRELKFCYGVFAPSGGFKVGFVNDIIP